MPSPLDAEPYAAEGGPVGAVVCHGFTSTPGSVRPWAADLAAAGLSVRAPLLPGHGTSIRDANRTRWPDWYAEVERAFDELTDRCTAVFAMGLSLGGALALHLAARRGEQVAGVVAVNPHLLSTRWDARYLLPWLRFVVPAFTGVGSDIAKPGVREPAYEKTPLRAAYSTLELGRMVRAELPAMTRPLLLLGSRVDHLVDPVNRQIVRDEAGAEDVEYVELANSWHVATLDHDAPLVSERSLAFVRRLVPTLPAGA